MTEGCHGGWGIFTGFFLQSFYTVSESCAKYTASTEVDGCKEFANCAPVAKVRDTYYVGGHYGGMSEQAIMKELRARGPLLFDLMSGPQF